ncbi:MAG: hypothetical protein AB1521_11595 [Bacteroidota bacterium]
MKKKIFFVLVVITFIIINSCAESITGPEPGRRDYVWTEDTIKVPFTYFNKIWGDASDNVWTVGPGGSLKTVIWRYDGNSWSTDGISRPISPLGVWGFGKNNVWISGNEGRIWFYNGVEWKQSIWFTKQNWTIGFQEIWGDSPRNIYATGYADSANVRKGIILHWDGSGWSEIPIPVFLTYNFIKIRRASIGGNYVLLGWGEKSNGGDLLALFEFDGKNIWKIYEADFVSETWADVSEIGGKLFFVIGNKICKYHNGQFEPIFEVDITKFNQGIWGRNEKDIFISMTDGIAHYSGADLQYLYHYTGNRHTALGGVILTKDIFFLTRDYNNYSNIVMRGVLP